RALWCADLRREVRQGRQVVSERRGFGGEPVTGQLHAVTGVTGETDHNSVELGDLSLTGCRQLAVAIGTRAHRSGNPSLPRLVCPRGPAAAGRPSADTSTLLCLLGTRLGV